MAEREFAIRLSTKGMDQTRAALKGMGADGAAALRQIDVASAKATPGLRAVDTAARDVREEFGRFADRIPIIGGALKELGPAGIAAGAGFAALSVGLVAIGRETAKAIDEISGLKDAADNVGLLTEEYQALTAVGLQAGITGEEMQKFLVTLAANTAKASEGFGKMKTALDKVNPELGRQLAATKTQGEAIDILAKALQGGTDRTLKLNVALAAFGGQGGAMIRVLDQAGASMDTFRESAAEAGLVISEKLVNEVEALGDRLGVLAARRKVAMQELLVEFGPTLEATMTEWTEIALRAGDAAQFLQGGEASLSALYRGVREALDGAAASQKKFDDEVTRGGDPRKLNIYRDEIAAAQAEAERLRRTIADMKTEAGSAPAGSGRVELETIPSMLKDGLTLPAWLAKQSEEAEKRRAEATRQATEAARIAQAMEKAGIAIRREMGDWTGAYAEKQDELNKLVEAGAISQDIATAALAKYRGELDGSTAAQARWQSAVDSSRTTVQQARAQVVELWDAYLSGEATLDQFNVLLPKFTNEIAAAEKAQMDAAGAALQWAFGIEQTKFAQTEASKATFQMNFALETTDGILNQQIKTLADVERAFLSTFANVAKQAIQTASQVKGAGLGDIFGAVIGAFGFGGAPSANVPVHHDGREIGDPRAATRMVPRSLFRNAPRHHTGLDPSLRPGERAIIAEDGERMFSRMDNARIVRAIEGGGGGGGKMEVNIHPPAGYQAETKQGRGANGGKSLDVGFVKMLKGAVGSGAINSEMNLLYGVKPHAAG